MNKNSSILLFVPILAIYLMGMKLDVMEIDAAQYAAISQEMLHTGNYLEIYDRGQDYLDKPPLLFWISSLSFKLFGISNFSYKLPSILFSLLGIWATYRLGKALYGKTTGLYSALVLSSCQAWFLMNNDVRTDTILAGCTAFSIWQLYSFLQTKNLSNLLAGSLGIAGAMLTKGPIGIMIPAISIGAHLLERQDWEKIFQWQWLLMLAIITICLSPMLWGLYRQYDLHPGKLINDVPINSGLTFYFWTQSFGRITGENVWKDDTTPLYFTHTFLWAFLPWCLFFLFGLWNDTRNLILAKVRRVQAGQEEALTWGGFVVPFVVFSFSHYKLPHYIFPLFPLAAIITGKYLNDLMAEKYGIVRVNLFRYTQFFIAWVLFVLAYLLCGISFPMAPSFFWIVALTGIILSCFFMFKGKSNFHRIVMPSLVGIVMFNFLLNVHVYPSLFQFVSSDNAAKMVSASREGSENLAGYKQQRYGLDFYSHRTVPNYRSVSELINSEKKKIIWVFADTKGYGEIAASGLKIIEVKKLSDFHISKLSLLFLNPDTRMGQVQANYLLKIEMSSL